MGVTAIEPVLRRDRSIVIAALVAVICVAWVYVLLGAGMDMTAALIAPMPWSAGHAVMMGAMWLIMMLAMMLPSAAPMILLFATIRRRSQPDGAPHLDVGRFAAGYALVWGVFSVFATLAQWGLERAALLSPTIAIGNAVLAGSIFIAAGIYQFTPLKQACLRHCRSPLEFLTKHWNDGSLRIGVRHGAFCLGCCWVLMALLFVGGVMNVVWIAGLALVVLIEKAAPAGDLVGRAIGGVLIAWGAFALTSALGTGGGG